MNVEIFFYSASNSINKVSEHTLLIVSMELLEAVRIKTQRRKRTWDEVIGGALGAGRGQVRLFLGSHFRVDVALGR